MKTTLGFRPQRCVAVIAMLCVGLTTGCRVLTVPWEHPTAFKKTPVCDAEGPCGDGCNVPPPPTINSDCYGFRFTCWHPWPEHCQPQCNGEGECLPANSTPVVPPPPMPEPAIPESPMPAEPPAAPMPSAADEQMTMRQYEATPRSAQAPPLRDFSRPAYSSLPTSAYANPSPPNYGYMSAVAESNATKRDDSVRPASSVTRLKSPAATNAAPSGGSQAPATDAKRDSARDGLERFKW